MEQQLETSPLAWLRDVSLPQIFLLQNGELAATTDEALSMHSQSSEAADLFEARLQAWAGFSLWPR